MCSSVIAFFGFAQLEPRPSRDHHDLVIEVVPEQLLQVERSGDSVDQPEHDHAEGVLQLGVLVELVQHDVGIGVSLQLDHQTHPAPPAGLVAEVRYVGDLPCLCELRDLL